MPVERIPTDLDAQAALYCSLLADRRMLLVLDNARDSGQVWPLLPGSPGCLVLVTSRHRLTSLLAGQGAQPVSLDLFTEAEAEGLLAARLGLVQEIIAACARLPLALTLVAARAAAHPDFPWRPWRVTCARRTPGWMPSSTLMIRPSTCGPGSPGLTGT